MRFLFAFTFALVLATLSTGCTREIVDTTPEPQATPERVAPLDLSLEGSPSMGPKDAKVTLVVSTDFECPYCSRLAPTLHAVHERYPESVRVVFKNNPLGYHKRAMPAAKAAMAAHVQGQFWPYHDKLFAAQRDMGDEVLERYAVELGLDVERWRVDKESEAVAVKILHDQASVVGLGARGTPTTFVNGKMLPGARPLEHFVNEVDQAIAEANVELARGTPAAYLHVALSTKNLGHGFVSSVIEGGAPVEPPKPKPVPEKKPERVEVPVHPDDAFVGPADAPIVLVQFSEFQCPFCAKLKGTLAALREAYPQELKIVFKHLPLPFHEAARPAAMASLAADAQGKFWAYHDLLFDNQRQLTAKDFEAHAKALKLNMRAFKRFIKEGAGEAHIARDVALAAKIGARGTPSCYINGMPIMGAQPLENFKALVDAELAALKD